MSLFSGPVSLSVFGQPIYIGLAIYIRCLYGFSGQKITRYTVICGAYTRLWPALPIHIQKLRRLQNCRKGAQWNVYVTTS